MALNFPSSPSDGDTYTYGSVTYYYDSANIAWTTTYVQPQGAIATINISTTPPISAVNGNLWWNSNIGRLLIYYTDADSSQWVDAFAASGLIVTGVTANTYGGSTNIPVFTVDTYGRITSASNVAVQGMDYVYANNVGTSGNTYANNVGTAGNTNLAVGLASANAWANTKLANTSGVATAGSLTISGIAYDSKGDLRDIPLNPQTSTYAISTTDTGKIIQANSNIFVPNAVFSGGQTIMIYNNTASAITITANGSVTMYLAGTSNTSVRNLSQRGLATIVCVLANTFVISGSGIS